jgi:hypothetical protein
LRYWLISAASGGLELPANILSSALCCAIFAFPLFELSF